MPSAMLLIFFTLGIVVLLYALFDIRNVESTKEVRILSIAIIILAIFNSIYIIIDILKGLI